MNLSKTFEAKLGVQKDSDLNRKPKVCLTLVSEERVKDTQFTIIERDHLARVPRSKVMMLVQNLIEQLGSKLTGTWESPKSIASERQRHVTEKPQEPVLHRKERLSPQCT